MQKENEKVFEFMINRSTEYSPDTIEMCRKKIFCFYKMAEMYTNNIYNDIRQQATDRSELTVLIGLDAIQKYRCRKLLRLWKIISWEHQRQNSNRVPTSDAMHETEDLITRNVAEFLNVVYDLRKWTELEIWIEFEWNKWTQKQSQPLISNSGIVYISSFHNSHANYQ